MYIVVSEWEVLPGKEEEFHRVAGAIGQILRTQPGVVMVEAFDSGGKKMAVHGYKDEATYRALVQDPNGVFARAVEESGLEKIARWVRSERGETIDF
ncbi:MAG TPA: antibiotic biosynthesis monooxygenase [Chthonomonadaceae bacterium]|nr:antibiotic biosynthesis monooxygenase [Chthonomonadaceae bacterium]